MQCPKCQAELTTAKSGTEDLTICPDCGGVWLATARFLQLLREEPQQLVHLASLATPRSIPLADQPGLCPCCGRELIEFPDATAPGISLDGCRFCKGIWLEHSDLKRLIARVAPVSVASVPAETAPAPPAAEATSSNEATRIAELRQERQRRAQLLSEPLPERFEYGGPKMLLLALPLALVFTQLLYWLRFPRFLMDWFSVTLHELGHALLFWLSARAATPISCGPGFGWTSGELKPSAFVFICVSFLLGYIGYQGIRHKSWGLVAFAAVLFSGQITFTFLVDKFTWQAIMIYAGIGGELILGTLAVIAFYYQLPARMRWDFFRFPFLVLGMYAFGKAALLWHRVEHGLASIPYGSCLARDDANGDMNRLRSLYGWSEEFITGLYVTTTVVCLLVILGHYVFFALRAHTTAARPSQQSTVAH